MLDLHETETTEMKPKKSGFFGWPRTVRTVIYLPIVGLFLFYGLRQFEHLVTHHPTPYTGGAEWTLPDNGEEVWFANAEGAKLNGWLLRARAAEAAGTVLYCHGNGGNLTNVKNIAQQMTSHGLDVLIWDYRGYGRSEGALTDEWGLYADGDAAYDYLTNQRGVNPRKLAIYGLSLGTTVAVDVAARKQCAALVVEAGLSSAREMAAVAAPWLPSLLHGFARNRFESARKITNVKVPVLVTHGTDDEIIPAEQGQKLFAAANAPKQMIVVPRGTHWLPGSGGKEYVDRVVTFIREKLK